MTLHGFQFYKKRVYISLPSVIWSLSTSQLTSLLSCSSQPKLFPVHVQSFQFLLTFFCGRSTPSPFCPSLSVQILSSLQYSDQRLHLSGGQILLPFSCTSPMVFSLHLSCTYSYTSSHTSVTPWREQLTTTSECLNFLYLVNVLHLIILCWIAWNMAVIRNVPD